MLTPVRNAAQGHQQKQVLPTHPGEQGAKEGEPTAQEDTPPPGGCSATGETLK